MSTRADPRHAILFMPQTYDRVRLMANASRALGSNIADCVKMTALYLGPYVVAAR